MAKNIPASAHPAICHRWRVRRPPRSRAPLVPRQPLLVQGSLRRGRGQAGPDRTLCGRCPCRSRGQVEGPGLPEPPACPGWLVSAWAALCSAVHRGWLAGSTSSGHSSGQARLAPLTGSAPSAGHRGWHPALSSPRGCGAHGPQEVCPCEAGAGGKCLQGHRAHAVRGHMARTIPCAPCSGAASPSPPRPCGCGSAGELAAPAPAALTIRRLLCTRGL